MYSSLIYTSSPVWLQEWLIAVQSLGKNMLREGSRFRPTLGEIDRTQWLTKQELEDYQLRWLTEIVRHASRHVPFYRDLFAVHGIAVDSLRSLTDFTHLPILTKRQIIAAGYTMVAENFRGLKFKAHTSGTTGTFLRGYRDIASIGRENAFLWRQLLWAGLRPGDRRAWLRGDMVVPLDRGRPPFWRYNRTDNMLMLSPFHLSDANADAYISVLEQFDPVVIQAYPASIAFLAKHLEARNRRYGGQHLAGIVTSSETLYDEQRRVVQEMFGVRVFDWYGSFERVTAIGTCEQGTYHILSDYGFTELLPSGDGTAEIVGTGFANTIMPLIRYRSVDSVVPGDPRSSCPCRRQFPIVEKILGRIDDQIKTPDGRHHTALDFIFYGMETLAEAQIVQDRLDHIILVVVPAANFGLADAEVLKRRAHDRLGGAVLVDVEVVKEIPRTKAGKFRGVVCKV